jgi:hypothetical protein
MCGRAGFAPRADADVAVNGVAAWFVLDGALDLIASLRLKVCGSSGST